MPCRVGLTLIALAVTAAAGSPDSPKDVEKQFEEFLKNHDKRYDEAEREKRFEIFVENAKQVAELNANEAGTAKYSLSGPFADWKPEEFVEYELVKDGVLHQQRSRHLRGLSVECRRCSETDVPLLDTSNLPTNFDWRTKYAVSPVQKQKCNDCWAFAGTAVLESAYVIQAGGPLTKFSEQQAIDCSVGSCGFGGFSFKFWRELVNTNEGLSTLADYPYRNECSGCDAKSAAHGCQSTKFGPKLRDWKKIAWDMHPRNNEDQMAAALMKYGPILVGIDARGLQFFAGKLTRPKTGGAGSTCTTADNHAVVVVGFGVEGGIKYWLIRNSWGPTWGDAGYIKMERGVGACGLNQFPITAIMEPRTYLKSPGGRRAWCSDRDQVDTAEECRKAGASVGHPFRKIVTTSGDRPGGCFWDQNGLSYFNTNLESTATWGGVGAICRGVYWKAEGAVTCPEKMQMIKTPEECRVAGATVGSSFKTILTTCGRGSYSVGNSCKAIPKPDFESRPPNGKCTYNDNLPGAALRGNAHTIIMSLSFNGQPFSKRQWIFNLGQETRGAHHWLWNNDNHIQFGMWAGNQIREGDISNARTLATVFDGSQYSLYIDGLRVGTKTVSMDIQSGSMAVGLGYDDAFKGCVHGVDIYRSALSDNQIWAAMNALPKAAPEVDFASGLRIPGGCFWHENGHSYFNSDFRSTATSAGVGGICSVLRLDLRFFVKPTQGNSITSSPP